jgi:hypothetical protein
MDYTYLSGALGWLIGVGMNLIVSPAFRSSVAHVFWWPYSHGLQPLLNKYWKINTRAIPRVGNRALITDPTVFPGSTLVDEKPEDNLKTSPQPPVETQEPRSKP